MPLQKSHVCEKSGSLDMGQKALGKSDCRISKRAISLEQNDGITWFSANTNSGKQQVSSIISRWVWSKTGMVFQVMVL